MKRTFSIAYSGNNKNLHVICAFLNATYSSLFGTSMICELERLVELKLLATEITMADKAK